MSGSLTVNAEERFSLFALFFFAESRSGDGENVALAIEPAPRGKGSTHIVVSEEEIVKQKRLLF